MKVVTIKTCLGFETFLFLGPALVRKRELHDLLLSEKLRVAVPPANPVPLRLPVAIR